MYDNVHGYYLSETIFEEGGLDRSKEALVTQVRVSSVHDE